MASSRCQPIRWHVQCRVVCMLSFDVFSVWSFSRPKASQETIISSQWRGAFRLPPLIDTRVDLKDARVITISSDSRFTGFRIGELWTPGDFDSKTFEGISLAAEVFVSTHKPEKVEYRASWKFSIFWIYKKISTDSLPADSQIFLIQLMPRLGKESAAFRTFWLQNLDSKVWRFLIVFIFDRLVLSWDYKLWIWD